MIGHCGCSSGVGAVLSGVRAELMAGTLSAALESAGLLDEHLAAGLEEVRSLGRDVTEVGLAVAKHDLLGSLLDAVG